MKKTLALFLSVLMMMALLAACGGSTSSSASAESTEPAASESTADESTEAPAEGDSEFPQSMALMLSGPVNDGGWAASAYAGLQAIGEKYGIETTFVESLAQSDFEEYFRTFAADGWDVVFGHGYEFGDAAMAVAPDFPDTIFIVSSTNISQGPNVASMNTLPVQNGFMQGTAAAFASKSGKIGAVGGMQIPSITDPLNGFYAGAVNANPDIEVMLSLTGDFEDVALIKEHAQTMIDAGCDVIMYNADSAGLGVLDLVKGTDIIAIPSVANQNDLAPENCLLSGITDVPKGMVYVFDQIMEGKFEAKFYELGVDTGCVYYEVNEPVFNEAVSDEGKAFLEDVKTKLGSGEIDAYAMIDELVPADKKLG